MVLPRLQLFEFNDLPFPKVLRVSVVEILSRTLRWSGIMDGLAEPFRQFLQETGADEVLDLCAGAGAPAAILSDALTQNGIDAPRFVLTDLHPQLSAWQALERTYPNLSHISEPIDATRIPAGSSKTRPRLIVNALHHFPPALAKSVVHDAVRSQAPIFVAEAFERNPMGFVRFFPHGLPALLLNPLLSTDQRVMKALLTWMVPVLPAVAAWDGFVSTLRIHTPNDLMGWGHSACAALDQTYRWKSGGFRTPMNGRGLWFYGVPT